MHVYGTSSIVFYIWSKDFLCSERCLNNNHFLLVAENTAIGQFLCTHNDYLCIVRGINVLEYLTHWNIHVRHVIVTCTYILYHCVQKVALLHHEGCVSGCGFNDGMTSTMQ